MIQNPEFGNKTLDDRKALSRSIRTAIFNENLWNKIGQIIFLNTSFVLPRKEYKKIDVDILALFDKHLLQIILEFSRTNYYIFNRYHRKKSFIRTIRDVLNYYLIFYSIKHRGFRYSYENRKSMPWMFIAKKISIRLDGHHRAGVCLHLGYEQIPVFIVTPQEICSNDTISDNLRKLLAELEEPDFTGMLPFTPP